MRSNRKQTSTGRGLRPGVAPTGHRPREPARKSQKAGFFNSPLSGAFLPLGWGITSVAAGPLTKPANNPVKAFLPLGWGITSVAAGPLTKPANNPVKAFLPLGWGITSVAAGPLTKPANTRQSWSCTDYCNQKTGDDCEHQ